MVCVHKGWSLVGLSKQDFFIARYVFVTTWQGNAGSFPCVLRKWHHIRHIPSCRNDFFFQPLSYLDYQMD